MAANTLLSCLDDVPPATACADARAGKAGAKLGNNSWDMRFVDVDSDAATFNSSRADVVLPADASILFAGLYWGANTRAGASGGQAAPNANAKNTRSVRHADERLRHGDRESRRRGHGDLAGRRISGVRGRDSARECGRRRRLHDGQRSDRQGARSLRGLVARCGLSLPQRVAPQHDGLRRLRDRQQRRPAAGAVSERVPHAGLRPRTVGGRLRGLRGRPLVGRRLRLPERDEEPGQPVRLAHQPALAKRSPPRRRTTTTSSASTPRSSTPQGCSPTAPRAPRSGW